MIVAAHGNVDAYCAAHGMTIGERYFGDVGEYAGRYLVLVTDNCEDLNDYYYLKYKLLRRKIELVSTHWGDDSVEDFVQYLAQREEEQRKNKYCGRLNFGFRKVDGKIVENPQEMVVVRRIIALRDAGAKYKEIVGDPDVCYPDGRRMSMSTVQVILKNRGKYE